MLGDLYPLYRSVRVDLSFNSTQLPRPPVGPKALHAYHFSIILFEMTKQKNNKQEPTKKQITEVSRDPADYYETPHLLTRFHRGYGPVSETRSNPPITDAVIRECIEEGRVSEARGSRICFSEVVDGVEWDLIAEADTNEVLTAYAPGYHNHPLSVKEVGQ